MKSEVVHWEKCFRSLYFGLETKKSYKIRNVVLMCIIRGSVKFLHASAVNE